MEPLSDRRGLFRGIWKKLGYFRGPSPFIRPPGALIEEEFLLRCARGRKCVDACPENCIIPAQEHMKPPTGTPFLLPDRVSCTLCGRCQEACSSGALLPTPAEEVRMALARVDLAACRSGRPEACRACRLACPVASQAIVFSEPGDPQILDGCTGCGQCAVACPTRAIRIRPRRR